MATSSRHLEIAARLLRDPAFPPSDRLPYTPEYDAFCLRFSEHFGREVSHKEVWESVVGARKRGLVGPTRRRRRSA